jgi:two-component system, LytTR family, response regulator
VQWRRASNGCPVAPGSTDPMTRPLRVLIVDDEPDTVGNSGRSLRAEPSLEIIGVAHTGNEAVTKVRTLQPDLVILDTETHRRSGLDVIRSLGAEMPLMIFVTAYSEHAVAALEEGAIDHLVDAFDREGLQRALAPVRNQTPGVDAEDLATRLAAVERATGSGYPDHVLVSESGTQLVRLAADEIEWIESSENYVRIHAGTRNYLHRTTLRDLEQRLDPARFLRIRHSAMVNVAHIASVVPWSSTQYQIELQGGTRLISTKLYRQRVRSLIL